MTEQKERAQGPQRLLNLDILRHFWDTMSRHFGDLPIDLSLFNYKAKTEKGLLVKQGVNGNVNIPIAQAYDAVLKLIKKYYHKGEDILWRPAYSLDEMALVDMLWVDDFRFDNELGLKPLVYIQTSPDKFQAFFKLKEPVPRKMAEDLQKALARLTGDPGASGYVQHRRMAGLANGKYEDDPLIIMFLGEEGNGIIDPAELKPIAMFEATPIEGAGGGVAENGTMAHKTQGETREPKITPRGRYIKPVIPVNYQPILIKERSEFIKRRSDGTIDDSATDMAWATHIARIAYEAGWDDGAIVLTIYEELGNHSPELQRRKKNPEHARKYLYMTAWKALMNVKNSDKPKADPRVDFGGKN